MRFIAFFLLLIPAVAVAQVVGYRNCVNFSSHYNFLYGFTSNYNIVFLKNNRTHNLIPTGREYQIALVGELYDPTAVFNFALDAGLKFMNLDLSRVDGIAYKTTTFFLNPYISYSPCLFNNVIGLRATPAMVDLRVASKSHYGRLGKVQLLWGAGIFLNKKFPIRLWQRNRYLVPFHAQFFAEYSQTYVGNYFNSDYSYADSVGWIYYPYALTKGTQRNVTFGLRLNYKYEH